MNEELDKIENKIDKILEKIEDIRINLGIQNTIINTHESYFKYIITGYVTLFIATFSTLIKVFIL